EIAREEFPRALTGDGARVRRRVQRTWVQVRYSRPGGIPLRVDESTADCRRVAAAFPVETGLAASPSARIEDAGGRRGKPRLYRVGTCHRRESCYHEIIKRLPHVQVFSIDDASRICVSPADLLGLLGPVPSFGHRTRGRAASAGPLFPSTRRKGDCGDAAVE